MGYVSTRMKKEINIESIVTIHYFEYMKNFVFQGESHDFWELLYVDKKYLFAQKTNGSHSTQGILSFIGQMNFMPLSPLAKKHQTLSRSPSTAFHPPCTCSRNYTPL